jgi:drug/metabolite transporter (DMT)-like permease
MSFLFIAIVCSVLLGFIFKLFLRFKVDTFQAIVFNYFTCLTCGWLHMGRFPVERSTFDMPWFPYALFLGFIFISGFYTSALTVRYFGVTVSQVMQKMSILVSVPFAVFVCGESAGIGKVAGFFMALLAIVLVNFPFRARESEQEGHKTGLWWIPLITWVFAGVIEVVFLKVQYGQLADMGQPDFIVTVFGTAGLVGLLFAVRGWATGKMVFAWKNLIAGIALGVPNYGSMLFMLWALADGLGGSVVFPVNNVGIIVATAIGAVLIFREHLSRINWAGVGLAALSIILMAF